MFSDAADSVSPDAVEVMLDGQPVAVPSDRRSLVAIRSYLDRLALQQQRILCSFTVDGQAANAARLSRSRASFNRVEGETIELEQMPLQLIESALAQAVHAKERAEEAVVLVLINDGQVAREVWWDLARDLKEPLVTLSLLPDAALRLPGDCVPPIQLRKWQLQQLAAIIRQVDEACGLEDTRALSNALENRALPWLATLIDTLSLWQQTMLAGRRAAPQRHELGNAR